MTEQNSETPDTTQALADRVNNRSHRPNSRAFRDFVASGWDRTPLHAEALAAAGFTVRANDTDYRFRAHPAFIHLTGLETDSEPDAVLVFEPTDDGHEVTLYFRPRAGADTEEFFSDSRYGEYWVGPRADLEAM